MTLQKSPKRSVTKVRIVEAAAQLFARQGFKAATTREIAQLADLTEVTIFRYFPRKRDLFWAVMESRLSQLRIGRNLQMSLAASADPAIAIPMIVKFLVNSFSQQPELQRLLHVAAFELPGAEDMIQEHLGRIFEALNSYFFRCAGKGTIGNVEPSLATLGLVGTVLANQYLRKYFDGEPSPNANTEEAIAALAQLWLRALQPSKSGATSSAS